MPRWRRSTSVSYTHLDVYKRQQRSLPVYALVEEGGDDHARIFRVSCTVAEPALHTEGEGSSRRAAEQQAAEAAMQVIEA